LKLKYDEPLSKIAFNFNLRRYKEVEDWNYRRVTTSMVMSLNQFIQLFQGTGVTS